MALWGTSREDSRESNSSDARDMVPAKPRDNDGGVSPGSLKDAQATRWLSGHEATARECASDRSDGESGHAQDHPEPGKVAQDCVKERSPHHQSKQARRDDEETTVSPKRIRLQLADQITAMLQRSALRHEERLDRATQQALDHAVNVLTRDSPKMRQKRTEPLTGLSAQMLQIGKWLRFSAFRECLLCLYAPEMRSFCWYLAHAGTSYKIQFSLSTVESITLVPSSAYSIGLDPLATGVAPHNQAKVEIALSARPWSFVEIPHVADSQRYSWVRCEDFTEEGQLSRCLVHTIHGDRTLLLNELVNLGRSDPKFGRLLHFDA